LFRIALGVVVDPGAIALTSEPGANVAITVVEVVGALTVYLVLSKSAFKAVAIGIEKCALAVHGIIAPLPFITIAIRPVLCALAMLYAIAKLAFIAGVI
jgi:hypothetical protein